MILGQLRIGARSTTYAALPASTGGEQSKAQKAQKWTQHTVVSTAFKSGQKSNTRKLVLKGGDWEATP